MELVANVHSDLEPNVVHRCSIKPNVGQLMITDHPTLENPSSSIMMQDNQVHIFFSENKQIILERQAQSNVVTAKQIDEGTPGLLLLRGTYTLIAVLMSGFLFVFCTQLVLFLFLGLAIESGLTSTQSHFHFGLFFGTLLAVPAFLFGMANAMSIAMAFIADTWNGQRSLKSAIKWDSVLVDWFSCIVFVFVPVMTGGISLCMGKDNWWEYTCIVWVVCVFSYYLIFAGVMIFYEIDGCLELVHIHASTKKISIRTIAYAILLKQRSMLSGFRRFRFIVRGSDPHRLHNDYDEVEKEHRDERWKFQLPTIGPLSFLTEKLSRCGCLYSTLDRPQRIYSIDEVRGYTPFVTKSSWGLEKFYCRNRNMSFVAIVQGESAVTLDQARSSFICYLLGLIFTLFLLVAMLSWFEISRVFIGVVCVIYIWCVYNSTMHSLTFRKIHDSLVLEKNRGIEAVETIAGLVATFRINEARPTLCWVLFALESLLFFLLPLITLFIVGNYPVGIVFVIVASITAARRFLSATICLRKFGTMDGMGNIDDPTERTTTIRAAEWRNKHRLEKVISQISQSRKKDFWVSIFAFCIILSCLIFVTAITFGVDAGESVGQIMSSNHKYDGSGDLQYPTCQVDGGISTRMGLQTSLADFSFLSIVAYEDRDTTKASLDTWFGSDMGDTSSANAIDHQDIVEQFQAVYDERKHGRSAVTYKLIGFPDQNVGVVSIRGTSNGWDAFTNAQLWSSAALTQGIRSILPLGDLLTPLLKYLVKAVSLIESRRLQNISYYRETTAFVTFLKKLGIYENIVITGHSLGGGLAIISGAQTHVPSVGISAPNAMISRLTFEPMISTVELERYTFNIVPDRDPIPRIDDLSQNYQRINCRSEPNAPVDCHSSLRSLCEILYTCGSNGRPIPCDCVHKYRYPKPDILNPALDSFDQICPGGETRSEDTL